MSALIGTSIAPVRRLSITNSNPLGNSAVTKIDKSGTVRNKDVSKRIDIEPGRTFAGFGFSLALSNLRKRLLRGEQVQLKAVGFSDFPTLGPQVVTVTISHGGVDCMKMSGRSLKGDRFIVHPEIPFIAKFFVTVPDTKIWLTNPAPAGFLRWEGPIVLPTDPIIRVDLVSGEKSGPAKSAGS